MGLVGHLISLIFVLTMPFMVWPGESYFTSVALILPSRKEGGWKYDFYYSFLAYSSKNLKHGGRGIHLSLLRETPWNDFIIYSGLNVVF